MSHANSARQRTAARLRRPGAERLRDMAIQTMGNVSVTAELFSEMCGPMDPQTLRQMEQAEILERAIVALLTARARA